MIPAQPSLSPTRPSLALFPTLRSPNTQPRHQDGGGLTPAWEEPAPPFTLSLCSSDHLPGEGDSLGVRVRAVICHPSAGLHRHSDRARPATVRVPLSRPEPGPPPLQGQGLLGVWRLQVRCRPVRECPATAGHVPSCQTCPRAGVTRATSARAASAARRAGAARSWRGAAARTTAPWCARGWATACVGSACATPATSRNVGSTGSSASATISTASATRAKCVAAKVLWGRECGCGKDAAGMARVRAKGRGAGHGRDKVHGVVNGRGKGLRREHRTGAWHGT